MAEDISLLNGIPPATDEIYYVQIKSVCVHSLCLCRSRSLAHPQHTGLKHRMLDLQTSWEGKRAKTLCVESDMPRNVIYMCAGTGKCSSVQSKTLLEINLYHITQCVKLIPFNLLPLGDLTDQLRISVLIRTRL